MILPSLEQLRHHRPRNRGELRAWIWQFAGVNVAPRAACRHHHAPLDWLSDQFLNRPPLILVLGARGSGKSFLEAILTHLESRFNPLLGTRILGGSKAQSFQIYEGLDRAIMRGGGPYGTSDRDTILKLLKTETTYRNGSHVSILAASPTAVRGPHVASLRLDEVDEIEPEIRDAALPMCMGIGGVSASVAMTSTWHRVGGPMGELLERADRGEFPRYTTCVFDVLERCPESRSGIHVGGDACYERCPGCPIREWCHAERDVNGDVPLAKLASGHYPIESLILQAKGLSGRAFEADMLCRGPKADGIWFTTFSDANISEAAEYDPALPVHLSIDSGVFTGAVAFQVRGDRVGHRVSVFMDYLAEGVSAESNARAIHAGLGGRVGTRLRVSTDSSGGARNPVGPTVIAEYERVGLVGSDGQIHRWPKASVADSISFLDGLICSADGHRDLTIHPRCVHLIAGIRNYMRARVHGQWMDYPPIQEQHPAEDLVDPLRCGLILEFPAGNAPPPRYTRVPARSVL